MILHDAPSSPAEDEAATVAAAAAASYCTAPSLPPSRYCLPSTSMVGKRLRKCTRRSTPSGGVQSYVGGVRPRMRSSSSRSTIRRRQPLVREAALLRHPPLLCRCVCAHSASALPPVACAERRHGAAQHARGLGSPARARVAFVAIRTLQLCNSIVPISYI